MSETEKRSFTAAEPGHTPPGGEGGGAMSGRGAEQGEGWRAQAKDARETAARNRPDPEAPGVGGGGVAGAGTGGAGVGRGAEAGLAGDAGQGRGSSQPGAGG